jgi:ADP-heptose:LPS heptosyltransferase
MIALASTREIFPESPEVVQAQNDDEFVLIGAQGLGDAVCLTGAVRDLHLAYPGRFRVHYQGVFPGLIKENPGYLSSMAGPDILRLIVCVGTDGYGDDAHFFEMWHIALAQAVGVPRIPVTRIGGDIRLSDAEKRLIPPIVDRPYWLVWAGGKDDFSVKWWPYYQRVVDALSDRIQFVQVGHEEHRHPPLKNVINLVGKTGSREMVQLVYRSHGVLGPVSAGIHLAAAVECMPGVERRAAVVISGGREPVQFIQYPGQKVLCKVGSMPCCARGGCWKSKQGADCRFPVRAVDGDEYAKCMVETPASEVIEAISGYLRADGIA